MYRRFQGHAVRSKSFSSAVSGAFGVFPRENEGNNYSVNWSLTEEGVVPKGDAFRNARLGVLNSRLSAKVADGKVEVKSPAYTGKYEVVEAGDSISHDEFEALLKAQQEHLSSGMDLFVEDGAICASTVGRLGVREVTDSAASALIARSMLISTPPREVDHRARFDGWNKDPRWQGGAEEGAFHGDKWVPAFAPRQSRGAVHAALAIGSAEDAEPPHATSAYFACSAAARRAQNPVSMLVQRGRAASGSSAPPPARFSGTAANWPCAPPCIKST